MCPDCKNISFQTNVRFVINLHVNLGGYNLHVNLGGVVRGRVDRESTVSSLAFLLQSSAVFCTFWELCKFCSRSKMFTEVVQYTAIHCNFPQPSGPSAISLQPRLLHKVLQKVFQKGLQVIQKVIPKSLPKNPPTNIQKVTPKRSKKSSQTDTKNGPRKTDTPLNYGEEKKSVVTLI